LIASNTILTVDILYLFLGLPIFLLFVLSGKVVTKEFDRAVFTNSVNE